jgi:hypothetical protein
VLRFHLCAVVTLLTIFGTSYAEYPESIQSVIDRAAQIKGLQPMTDFGPEYPPVKCGTPFMMALYELQKQGIALPASVLQERADYLPYTYGGTHILIHYDTAGEDAIFEANIDVNPADGHPDYINELLDIFELVWSYEVDTLAYGPPLTDNGRGEDNRLDVYMVNLGTGVYGFTYPDPDSNYFQMPAYIEVDNDVAGTSYGGSHATVIQAAKVTAAHEFFHTIQYAYDESEFDYDNPNDPNTFKPWWLEASSTWMEDIVYDDVNDYINYLPFFLGYPQWGLGIFGPTGARILHAYGACLWPIYLSEKYGVDTIRRIWLGCASRPGYNLPAVTDTLMRFYSTDFERSFLEFAVWNTKDSSYADPDSSYDEGAAFPFPDTSVNIGTLTTAPLDFGHLGPAPEHMGVNYIVIASGAQNGGVAIEFDGDDLSGDAGWYVAAVGHRQGYSPWHDLEVFPSSGTGVGEMRDWNNYFDVTIVAAVAGLTPDYNSYNYLGTVRFDPSLVGDAPNPGFKLLAAYPSPYIIGSAGQQMNIQYSLDKNYCAASLSIWVFDVGGNRMREIKNIDANRGIQTGASWDGRNDGGEPVASGIYILHLEGAGNSSSMKIAVLNNIR